MGTACRWVVATVSLLGGVSVPGPSPGSVGVRNAFQPLEVGGPLGPMVASAEIVALVREDGLFTMEPGEGAASEWSEAHQAPRRRRVYPPIGDQFGEGVVLATYEGTPRGDVLRYRLWAVAPEIPENPGALTAQRTTRFERYDEPKFVLIFVHDQSAGDLVGGGRVVGGLEQLSALGERLRCVMDLQASTDETIARLRSVVGGDFFFGMMLDEFEFRRIPADDAPCVPRTLDAELQVRMGFATRPESGPVLPLVLRLAGVTEDPAFDVAVLEVLEDAVASLAGAACGDESARCSVPAWLREAAVLLEERVTLASPRLGRPETWDDVDATLRRLARVIRKE